MNPDYKPELNQLLAQKKKEIPTAGSSDSIKNIFRILEETTSELRKLSKNFSDKNFNTPVIPGKRSFRETLIHLLNIETLNYTTIYAAFLLDKPKVYPLHAERDINRLNLYKEFSKDELLNSFEIERKKTINFFRSLNDNDWSKQLIEDNKERQETIYWRARGQALHDFTHINILKLQLGS